MFKLQKILYVFILSSIALASCTKLNEDSEISSPEVKEKIVTIKLNTPSGFPSKIRSLSELQESSVEHVYVLAFKSDVLSYVRIAERIEGENSVTVVLRSSSDSSDKYKLMIIANSESILNPIFEGSLSSLNGKTYVEVQQLLKHSGITQPLYKDGGSIAMWGETASEIEINNSNSSLDIKMIRAISRVDVGVGANGYDQITKLANWEGLPNFELEAVYLYNANDSYYLAPSLSNFNTDNNSVTSASPVGSKVVNPFEYTGVNGGVSLVRHIYLPESDVQMSANPLVGDYNHRKRMALVVKGSYRGNPSSYYRIDFLDENKKLQDVLRNHLYQINISKVSGNGWESADKAYESLSINMIVDIVAWNDGDIGDITVDGQYMLGVSTGNIEIPKDEQTELHTNYSFTAVTDYHEGWVIDRIVSGDDDQTSINWLSVDRASGNANTKTTVKIIASENNTKEIRVANIHIRAGRIEYTVKITQGISPEISLNLTNEAGRVINKLVFEPQVGGVVPAQFLDVSWLPKGADLNIIATPIRGIFDFGSGDAISTGVVKDANGHRRYTVQPPAFTQEQMDSDPFIERLLRVEFQVNNEASYEIRTLFLEQSNYTAIPKIEENFLMNGTEKSFTIRANAPWKIEVTSDPSRVLTQLRTKSGGEASDKSEERVYFTLANNINNPLIPEAIVTLTIKSTNATRPFADKVIVLKAYAGEILPLSNSYIVQPSSMLYKGYLIPIQRANQGIVGSVNAADRFSTELIWSDEQNHISTIKLDDVGVGNGGYIYVMPPATFGNAVVAVKVNGVIKWSWHLWVTDYDPATTFKTLGAYNLMDRNLGALASVPGAVSSTGLYYQWGRKDPFPGAMSTSGTVNKDIYNMSGAINTIPESSTGSNLAFTVQNPFTYLITGSTWNGSTGSTSWINGGKTVYDPCPVGWKVAPVNVWNTLNTTNFTWTTLNGRYHSTAGWFPAAGARQRGSSNLINTATHGLYNSANFGNPPYTQSLGFTDSFLNATVANYYYLEGLSVRCVKE